MMEIKQVDIDCIDVFWDGVKGWIEKVVRQTNGRHTVETTYRRLKQGIMTMFLVMHNKKVTAVIVTQVVIYPAKNVLGFLFIGGKKVCNYLKEIEDYFIKYTRSLGLDMIDCCGRKGWIKVLKEQKQTMKLTGYAYEIFA